jgi:thioredoxin-dependent peroxiredoxin
MRAARAFAQLPVTLFAVAGALASTATLAALPNGTKAPDFTTQASLAGKPFTFSLSETLKQGPVVLYFYPAAFTKGCTIEAHNFAEATDEFKSLGATVIGVSHDDIETLHKFSVSECRNKFAVAADADKKIMKSYDAQLMLKPDWAKRTSYVIAPTGEIVYSYNSLNPDKHVANTMAAVRKWAAEHPAAAVTSVHQ